MAFAVAFAKTTETKKKEIVAVNLWFRFTCGCLAELVGFAGFAWEQEQGSKFKVASTHGTTPTHTIPLSKKAMPRTTGMERRLL